MKIHNTNKVIFHIDVDSFFVSSEITLRPELKDRDVAICPSYKKNGIVSSLSYSAKRKGAKVPMHLEEVKKFCPDIVTLKPNFYLYSNISNNLFNYFKEKYTDKIEIGSIDEWFLDFTNKWKKYGNIKKLACKLQEDIKNEFSLDISIGVSWTKFLAKMSTSLNKPKGITITTPKNIKENIWSLPIESFWGFGNQITQKLFNENIKTIKDFALIDISDKKWNSIFKNTLLKHYNNIYGIGDDKINDNKNKLDAISNSITFPEGPKNNIISIYNHLKDVFLISWERLNQRELQCSNISVGIKKAKHKFTFKSISLSQPTNEYKIIYENVMKLIDVVWSGEDILGVVVSLNNLSSIRNSSSPIDLFKKNESRNKVDALIHDLNDLKQDKIFFTLIEYQNNLEIKSKQGKYLNLTNKKNI